MGEKRKDSKGRILNKGETQRKDGSYMYTYKDVNGKKKCIYSWRLVPSDKHLNGKNRGDSLREKETKILQDLREGICSDDRLTVIDLVDKYLSTKNGVRVSTKKEYLSYRENLRKESFCSRRAVKVKMSDAKQFFSELYNRGMSYGYITNLKIILKAAFQIAVDDDMLRKNPFAFRLDSVIPNNSERRQALNPEEERKFLEYVLSDNCFRKQYDSMVILLGTGLRISEFAGLTMHDVDFDLMRVHVNHQLLKNNSRFYIEKPKTKSGERYIPMTDEVADAFRNIIANRKPNKKITVDGYTDFVVLTTQGTPICSTNFEKNLRYIVNKYNSTHEDKLPRITPHILRHTFCTKMCNLGMNITVLQYIMGHSDPSVTLRVYTHMDFNSASAEMKRVSSNVK